jgi:hypothetical protein
MTKKEAKKLLKDYTDFLNKDHKGMYIKVSDYSLNKYIKEQLFIPDVVLQSEQLCDNPHCEDGIVDRDVFEHPIYCQVCDSHN